MTGKDMNNYYCYLKLNDEEVKIFDSVIEQLGFHNRTDYTTACAHVLIYGRNPFEWNKNLNNLHSICELQKKTFFEIIHENAFPAIAMNGIGTVIASGMLEDIKKELLKRCKMIPEESDLRKWLKIYKNLHRDELSLHRAKMISEDLGGDNERT